MAKYLYTTVYEQFTGQKPPEPEPKPEHRQRKTHGHPYRMRHNMQNQRDQDQQEGDFQPPSYQHENQHHSGNGYNNTRSSHNHAGHNNKGTGHPFRQNRARQQAGYYNNQQPQQSTYEAGEPRSRQNQAAPKVVYKKRRQFQSPQDSQQQYDA
ncbi:hypothetical protein H0A36_08075 [Endozoicomonas sp. SM1973]|uniref:Uncharacterized protein n=1 Tax=Spartinivicinus marinus TaxID=2994442 RepID=A0A853I5L2_9GAMM|nr:hypothetical protein [Spartinivicinus marinus]MCX4025247.1 hypothetical protein [Spartinivicinus marinus]NYZ65968.1 hypothetical protein [Spartinivicinus marinus]